jgi:hypothetical protein
MTPGTSNSCASCHSASTAPALREAHSQRVRAGQAREEGLGLAEIDQGADRGLAVGPPTALHDPVVGLTVTGEALVLLCQIRSIPNETREAIASDHF